jgi:hypothetical protein
LEIKKKKNQIFLKNKVFYLGHSPTLIKKNRFHYLKIKGIIRLNKLINIKILNIVIPSRQKKIKIKIKNNEIIN